MTAFANILMATDFGDVSSRAEDVACEIAVRFGAKLTVMHALELTIPRHVEQLMPPDAEMERAAREALDGTVERLRPAHRDVRALLVRGGAPFAIVQEVEAHGFDLIVIGTHGRRGVSRFVLGSVAEKVLRMATVPVLIVNGGDAT